MMMIKPGLKKEKELKIRMGNGDCSSSSSDDDDDRQRQFVLHTTYNHPLNRIPPFPLSP